MAATRQYGDLATQLVHESRRSTATDTLAKYNDVLVRAVVREQRQLESLLQAALADTVSPDVILYQTILLRNKRCLLAYHHHRLQRLKDLYWAVAGALPLLLAANADVRARLSPHEVDFLRAYNDAVLHYRSGVLASEEVDLFAPITKPPKDLHVHVRVIRDCGLIQTELGAIDFKLGQRFMVRRADVEHLIVQGYLDEV